MRIYTRTGDEGDTHLLGGQRISKSDLQVECYGTVDELSSVLGMVRSVTTRSKIRSEIFNVQQNLMTIGSLLAANNQDDITSGLTGQEVCWLETMIDEKQKDLPELRSFIIPGDSLESASLHMARSVCRRAERLVVALKERQGLVDENALIYLNRLSDYLFTLARWVIQ